MVDASLGPIDVLTYSKSITIENYNDNPSSADDSKNKWGCFITITGFQSL